LKKTLIFVVVALVALLVTGAAFAATASRQGALGAPAKAAVRGGPVMFGKNISDDIAKATGMTAADVMKARLGGKSFAAILTEKGKSVDQFSAQLLSERKALLDKAVADKKLTTDQADKMLTAFQASIKPMLESTATKPALDRKPMAPKAGAMMPGRNLVDDIAAATGMTKADILAARQAGKSYAVILTEKGKNVDQFVAQIVANQKTALDKAVADKKMTSEQAEKMLKVISERTKAMLVSTSTAKPGARPAGPKVKAPVFGQDLIGKIATTTGMTPADVMKARQGGKSYAQMLTEKGVNIDQFAAGLVTEMKAGLDKAVAAKQLTQEKADQFLKGFQNSIKSMLESTTTGPTLRKAPGKDATKNATPKTNVKKLKSL